MAHSLPSRHELSDGNELYLYRLLVKNLGIGKQTFAAKVDEALASDGLGAAELGFESTRALLEALDRFVTLTVFKGGRCYATLVAVPEWDAALEAEAAGRQVGAGKGGKPWKRKKGARAVKPVRPRCVKPEEPQPDEGPASKPPAPQKADDPEMPVPGSETSATPGEAASPTAPGATEDAGDAAKGGDAEGRPQPLDTAGDAPEGPAPDAPAPAEPASEERAPEATAPVEAPVPARAAGISLTVTYDPYTGSDEETVLVAKGAETPGDAGVHAAASAATAPAGAAPGTGPDASSGHVDTTGNHSGSDSAPAPTPGPDSRPNGAAAAPAAAESPRVERVVIRVPDSMRAPEPEREDGGEDDGPVPTDLALRGYPRDFTAEVRCPAELLGMLVRIVPMGDDALCALTEDFRVARGAGTVRGTRGRASFPTRYATEDGDPVRVTIKRDSGLAGASWVIEALSGVTPAALAASGIEGLPLLADGPWFDAETRPRQALASSPLRALFQTISLTDAPLSDLAERACPAVWTRHALKLQLALALQSAREQGLLEEDGESLSFPTGLFDARAHPLVARAVPADDDIPWRLAGIEANAQPKRR